MIPRGWHMRNAATLSRRCGYTMRYPERHVHSTRGRYKAKTAVLYQNGTQEKAPESTLCLSSLSVSLPPSLSFYLNPSPTSACSSSSPLSDVQCTSTDLPSQRLHVSPVLTPCHSLSRAFIPRHPPPRDKAGLPRRLAPPRTPRAAPLDAAATGTPPREPFPPIPSTSSA